MEKKVYNYMLLAKLLYIVSLVSFIVAVTISFFLLKGETGLGVIKLLKITRIDIVFCDLFIISIILIGIFIRLPKSESECNVSYKTVLARFIILNPIFLSILVLTFVLSYIGISTFYFSIISENVKVFLLNVFGYNFVWLLPYICAHVCYIKVIETLKIIKKSKESLKE